MMSPANAWLVSLESTSLTCHLALTHREVFKIRNTDISESLNQKNSGNCKELCFTSKRNKAGNASKLCQYKNSLGDYPAITKRLTELRGKLSILGLPDFTILHFRWHFTTRNSLFFFVVTTSPVKKNNYLSKGYMEVYC